MKRSMATFALLACLMLVGCVPTSVTSRQPTSVTVVLTPPAPTLNPYSQSLSSRQIGRLVFSGLLGIGNDLAPVPGLAEEVPTRANGGISADGRSVTYKLRPAVRWHDGKPVTARDVAFTIGLQADGTLVDEAGVDFSVVQTVTAVDDRTVVVRLKRPDSPLAWRLAPYVLPEHLLAGSNDLASSPYWIKPVGSGPYKVGAVDPGTSVRLDPVSTGLALDVVFASGEPAAAAKFAEGGAAVWPGTELAPVGAERAVESTIAAQWSRLYFNLSPDRKTASRAVRATVRANTPVQMRADDVTRAPYGFKPRRVPAVLPATPPRSALASTFADIRVAVAAPSPALGSRFEALIAQWRSKGVGAKLVPGANRFYGSALEAGSLWSGEWEIAWADLPVGVPAGWAWPYGASAAPSESRPYAPGFAAVSDPELVRLGERVRAAGDPAEAAAAARAALELEDALDISIWDRPHPGRALVRGVGGVSLSPLPAEALASAPSWRIEAIR